LPTKNVTVRLEPVKKLNQKWKHFKEMIDRTLRQPVAKGEVNAPLLTLLKQKQ
jgi:hypothetical protein